MKEEKQKLLHQIYMYVCVSVLYPIKFSLVLLPERGAFVDQRACTYEQ